MRLPLPVDPRVVLGLLPRAVALLDSAEALLDRVDALVDRIEHTRQEADKVIIRTAGTVGSIEPTLERTERLIRTWDALLGELAPSVRAMEPILRRIADTTSSQEVESMVDLVDHLPHLVTALDEQVLPILTTLETVAPDIHELLETTREITEALSKVPGLGRLRRSDA